MTSGAPDCWNEDTSVLFTSFWGWSPETWGTVGWTKERGLARRTNLLAQLSDPFITVCYVTSNKSFIDSDLKGKIAGFYLVSHETGDRDVFTHPIHHAREPEKWRHSLRALRAFSYLPEHRFSVTDLDPAFISRARSISAMGEIIIDPGLIARLRQTPFEEVEIYQPAGFPGDAALMQGTTKGLVPAGPASSTGYTVESGSQLLPRELYVLRLEGGTKAWLGRDCGQQIIVKVGLGASPELRRQSFQKAMPRGVFTWQLDRSTRSCGLKPYPSHAVAVQGEYAMKHHLAAHAEWLGGEFYLAPPEVVDAAWQAGCKAVR